MPDFEAMSDADLKQYKLDRYNAMRSARFEMRAADAVLEGRRVRADAHWRRAVYIAQRLPGADSENHTENAERLNALSETELDAEAERIGANQELTREQRRALRVQGATVVAPTGNPAVRTEPRG